MNFNTYTVELPRALNGAPILPCKPFITSLTDAVVAAEALADLEVLAGLTVVDHFNHLMSLEIALRNQE